MKDFDSKKSKKSRRTKALLRKTVLGSHAYLEDSNNLMAN